MFDGNAGRLSPAASLPRKTSVFCGTYNADTNQIVALTDEGTAEQLDGSAALVGWFSSFQRRTHRCPVVRTDNLSGHLLPDRYRRHHLTVTDVIGTSFAAGDIVAAAVSAKRAGLTYRRVDPNQRADDLQGGDWRPGGTPPPLQERSRSPLERYQQLHRLGPSEWQTNARQPETIATAVTSTGHKTSSVLSQPPAHRSAAFTCSLRWKRPRTPPANSSSTTQSPPAAPTVGSDFDKQQCYRLRNLLSA